MKLPIALCMAAAAVVGAGTAQAENSVKWETLGNYMNSHGKPEWVQRFTIQADKPFERMAFCMLKQPMTTANPADTLIEILPGYWCVASPRFAQANGQPIVVDLIGTRPLKNRAFAPDAFHLVRDGKPVRVTNIVTPMTNRREQWYDPQKGADNMVYGQQAFVINDSLSSTQVTDAYMQVPTPKSVQFKGRKRVKPTKFTVIPVQNDHAEYWRAEVTGPEVKIYTNITKPSVINTQVIDRINRAKDAKGQVPAAVIESWPDYDYRAIMLDVARNFTKFDDVKQVLRMMHAYNLNLFHFHVGDDEGWRLEMPSLPELTKVGARRGYTMTDDVDFLKGIYSGDGNPNATDTPANGHYTKAQFIELLRYADSLGIKVMPEFDSPGHSRAAIRAMEWRIKQGGDAKLRLIDPADTSVYTTAQDFHDNLMNPGVEGPYLFWDIVLTDLERMYAEAGVEMPAVHIGGDEVPHHAWDGSPAVQKLMKDKGLTEQREVHAYFNRRLAEVFRRHNAKMAGWQEVALDHGAAYDAEVAPVTYGVNCWTRAGQIEGKMAQAGYPVILSNVNYLYYDLNHSSHPEETGLIWGGIVDEFKPLQATVDKLCPGTPETQANVRGISAQLWAETVRSPKMVMKYYLPRVMALSERAHNKHTTIDNPTYFAAIKGEMHRWADQYSNFYVRQPGIRLVDGQVEMNDPYGFGQIRYTLDGTEPTAQSPLYTAPFPAGDARQIRARYYYGPAESVTSIMFVDQAK